MRVAGNILVILYTLNNLIMKKNTLNWEVIVKLDKFSTPTDGIE